MNEQTLNSLKTGTKAVVSYLCGPDAVSDRLLDLGFVGGEEITVLQKLAGGGPVVVEYRGTKLSLRQDEAHCVRVLP